MTGKITIFSPPQDHPSLDASKVVRRAHLGVEGNGCDKVNVLEATEALFAGDVPQTDGFIHGGGKNEEILQRNRNHNVQNDIMMAESAG